MAAVHRAFTSLRGRGWPALASAPAIFQPAQPAPARGAPATLAGPHPPPLPWRLHPFPPTAPPPRHRLHPAPVLLAVLAAALLRGWRRQRRWGRRRAVLAEPYACAAVGAGAPGADRFLEQLALRCPAAAQVHISSAFDGGSVVCDDCADPAHIRLRLRRDPYTTGTDRTAHAQCYSFRTSNVRGTPCTFRLVDCHKASFPASWPGTQACASYDRVVWFRVPTWYDPDSGTLEWSLTPRQDVVWFASFAPYSDERHQRLVARLAGAGAALAVLGGTLDGRPLDLLTVGTGPLRVWVLARQHPGETMAEWLVEGFLAALTQPTPAGVEVQRQATVRVVPNMNPDGSVRGHFRTNACGANLNREWAPTGLHAAPTLAQSPEVWHVLDAVQEVGCDLLLDVHGDEGVPAVFLVDNAGIPNWTPRLQQLHDSFSAALLAASPDFQTTLGYAVQAPGTSNLAHCSDQLAQRFDCLSVTLEQPFKDAANAPDPAHGWSPQRAMVLGNHVVEAIAAVLPLVR